MSDEADSKESKDSGSTSPPDVGSPTASSSPPEFKWLPLHRDYQIEYNTLAASCKLSLVKLHPLLPRDVLAAVSKKAGSGSVTPEADGEIDSISVKKKKEEEKDDGDDPLAFMKISSKKPTSSTAAAFDPLSQIVAASGPISSTASSYTPASLAAPEKAKKTGTAVVGDYEPWRDKRPKILSRYTTNKKIAVSANFLEEEVKAAAKPVEGVKNRLEELETPDPTNTATNLLMTQKEYIVHIEEQHDRLKSAWDAGERVTSLKIAIQCAKLLGDTSVPQFYPSMYVLLTDILDSFGDLVFDRIKKKGIETIDRHTKQKVQSSLPPSFTHTDVAASAQETCKNWFYKTACIRELLPRLYVDMCLLKCYRFLEDSSAFVRHFQRISRMIRGIGDPLCALYARCYLATKMGDVYMSFHTETAKSGESRHIPSEYQPVLLETYDDLLYTYKHLAADNWSSVKYIKEEKISLDEYLDLFAPAIEWVIQSVGYKGSEALFMRMVKTYRDSANNSGILIHLLSVFDASIVAKYAMDMTLLIKESTETKSYPKSTLYLALGKTLIKHAPPVNQRLAILNDVWKTVTKMNDPLPYIEVAEVYIQYVLINFTDREVNKLLADILKHVKKDNAYKTLQDPLALIVGHIMSMCKDLSKTLTMDTFLLVLDLLEKKAKLTASKAVLMTFQRAGFSTADPVIIHTLFDVARTLHDSVDSLTFDDERRQISLLIISFIRQIDYGRDLEQQLTQMVECRQAFTALEIVTQELILRVALLAMKAHSFVKGSHTKKTAAFVKACLAYCHITIPSLDDIFSRLRLLLICGQVALVNQMIVQGEGFLKAAISLIPDVPPTVELMKVQVSTDDDLISFLRNFTSFLLLFPGHPDNGPFYLVTGLLNAVKAYTPWSNDTSAATVAKVKFYMGVLSLFFTYYQRDFPYHIPEVESNDALYGGSADYMRQLATFIDTLMTEIMSLLMKLGERTDLVSKKQQGTLALDFMNMLLTSLTMNATSATLIVKLYQLAFKQGTAVESVYMHATLNHLAGKKSVWYQDILTKIQGAGATTPGGSTAPAAATSPLAASTDKKVPATASPLAASSTDKKNPLSSPDKQEVKGGPLLSTKVSVGTGKGPL